MKRLTTVLLMLVVTLVPSFAFAESACCQSGDSSRSTADQPPTAWQTETGLPVHKDAKPVMEVNVGIEDILPAFQSAMPLAARVLGRSLDERDSAEVVKALENVTHLAAIQWDIPASKATDNAIIRFLIDKRPGREYAKVLSHNHKTLGIVQVYAKPGGESLYMFHISKVEENGVKIKRVEVARLEGRVEYFRLVPIIQKLLQ